MLLACYDGAEELPAIRRQTWYRFWALLRSRRPREIRRPVWQMLGWLTEFADAAGRVGDVAKMITTYAAHHQVTEATGWEHWRLARELGAVRQTRHPAPGQKARYVLALDPDRVPDDCPTDLARLLDAWADHVDERAEEAAEVELVRYGSCRARADARGGAGMACSIGCSEQNPEASPSYAKAHPPSPRKSRPRRTIRPAPGPARGISDEERRQAMSVLTACRPRWCDQLAAGGVPDLDQLADLVPLLAVTLRWITAADAVEVLSERVASARDLPSLLRWRLQGTLRDHRRRRTLAVDEDGAQYRARARARAAAAAERHASTAALRRAVRERLDEVRRVRAARASTRAARPPLVPSAPTAVEPGETFQPPAVEPGAHDDQMLRDAVAAHRRGGQPAPVRDVLAHLPRRADA